MARKERLIKKSSRVSDAAAEYLITGIVPPGDLDMFIWKNDDEAVRAAWESRRDEILAEVVKRSPGSRPWAWWKFDAPEPRRRVGGRGTLRYEVFTGWKTWLAYGIPKHVSNWIIEADVRVGVAAIPLDPENPPTFESEARFLKRLGLLLPGEKARLTEADFSDEVIEKVDDDEIGDNNKEGL